jgi:hypothetical protein
MRKDLIWSIFAIALALVMFVVAACATDPNPNSPSPAVTAQPASGQQTGPKRSGPGDGPRPEMFMHELPQILMNAALNPQTKNDPEVQKLLDKAIADMQILQQDEAARLPAFQLLVQAQRNDDTAAAKQAWDALNAASLKLKADAMQFLQQDMLPLRKRIQELRTKAGATPEAGYRQGNGGNSRTTPSEN